MDRNDAWPCQGLRLACLLAVVVVMAVAGLARRARGVETTPQGASIDFRRDVQPILRRHCYRCHGPSKREGGFSLAHRDSALGRGDSDEPLIVPGAPQKSLLMRRLLDDSIGDRMPLDASPLSSRDVATLRRWIASGAAWPHDMATARHWAYVAPRRPKLPGVRHRTWPRNAIDYFILHRLERENIEPAAEEDPARWLRRISLALTGLPPTPQATRALLRDPSPAARQAVVDRLLASPRYGEHWARFWLDLARYADSNGFQADQYREIWPYRDWVIRAFNRDLPFDQFVIEQLAGDLLDHPTTDQRIATGFHRTVTCNVEAGVDPEANRIQQVFDRVSTTATVFLGTTLECCQCHDHKYDPFTMRDYYAMFAYFNNTPLEVKKTSGVTWDFYGPKLTLPVDAARQRRHQVLQAKLARLRREKAPAKELARLQRQIAKAAPPTTLVMVELPSPRDSFILRRGNYLDRGEKVPPGTPAILHPLDPALPRNRLGLARWLVARDNPLLARVMVNRIWAQLFGRGIVATLEDFGTQSEPPTHPELLDWLAVEFMESGWSVKHVLRCIALSATYGQSARRRYRKTEAGRREAIDPENRWYARGPRFRLPAETIRDNALAIAGLLSTEMYGPPSMPYQPKGLWRSVGRNQPKWITATDSRRFRRGIYVMWKRAAPYPSFTTFDAPDRTACTVRRPRTNTPLQALTLLNDPAYAELAVALAERMVAATPHRSPRERAAYGMRLCVARRPAAEELEALVGLYRKELAILRERPDLVSKRLGNLSPKWRRNGLDRLEVAAWFAVANALLNLDETISY